MKRGLIILCPPPLEWDMEWFADELRPPLQGEIVVERLGKSEGIEIGKMEFTCLPIRSVGASSASNVVCPSLDGLHVRAVFIRLSRIIRPLDIGDVKDGCSHDLTMVEDSTGRNRSSW